MKRLKYLCRSYNQRKSNVLFLLLFIIVGCSGVRETTGDVEYTDRGYYKNHVNSELIREQIEDGFESVVRIQNNVIYRTFQFYVDDMPLESELKGQDLDNIAVGSYLDDQSTAGTAVVLSNFRGKYTLLTAAHTVFYPDTIWHYNSEEGARVEAVSIRQSSNHFVLVERGIIKLEFVLHDSRRDLAIMTNSSNDVDGLLTPLSLPMGNSERLGWADLVYALGYPKGAKMVTLGTVSRSDHPTRSIIIDASFNRGFSGGAIFAVRNDGAGLEWMGIVTSALGENEIYLAPEKVDANEEFNPDIPYNGEIFVRSTPRINYGITNAVSIKEIQEFFSENEDRLNDSGMVIPSR